MNRSEPEFDQFSDSYAELLKDPIRDRFSPGGTGFFHVRKRDLIRKHFRQRGMDTRKMRYLDLGCGKGDLVSLLRDDFARVSGCDASEGMLRAGGLLEKGIDARFQEDPARIPFGAGEFDFVTAVCIFHHVPLPARVALLREARRVVKPGGTLAIIEHNPFNPATRLIVSRTPVDADAVLLRPAETRRLFRESGLTVEDQEYFLYFPESVYCRLSWLETVLRKLPLGGQYAVFGRSL